MKKKQLALFSNICRMNQTILKYYLKTQLTNFGYRVHEEDGFLYAKGKIPVLLVAHMDTVHLKQPIKIDITNDIISSPQGIGGDDRCGVFMIMEIVKTLNCSVLFTEDEEIGTVGANKFCKHSISAEVNPNYIIELDRRGRNDAVFYDCDNKDFEKFIIEDKFFETDWGSFSDISDIAPHLGVAAVNLSCGYYNEHTKKESVVLSEMMTIIEEVKKIIQKPCEKQFEYIEAPRSYWRLGNYYKGGLSYSKNKTYNDYEIYNDVFDLTDNSFCGNVWGKHLYIIYWNDSDCMCIESYSWGDTEEEALGYFFKANPDVAYDYILDCYNVDPTAIQTEQKIMEQEEEVMKWTKENSEDYANNRS